MVIAIQVDDGLILSDIASRLVKDGNVEVRVDGPYGDTSEDPKWASYEVLIIFAGGIGVRL